MRRTHLVVAASSALLSLSVHAQTVYAPAGDTLRFREVTHTDIRMTTPQGEIPIKSEHAATIAVVRLPGDSAQGWYEALTIGLSGPMGNLQPATDSALNTPFTLRFDARGRVRLLAAPTFPAAFQVVTDLSHQFDDFFLRLPTQTLRVGLAWSDTSIRMDSTAERYTRWRAIGLYRVERDTVVHGLPAVVVSMRQQLQSRSASTMPGQQTRVESQFDGSEEGFFVFAPRAGRLLGRRRDGRLQGDLTVRGATRQQVVKQAFTYSGVIDATAR